MVRTQNNTQRNALSEPVPHHLRSRTPSLPAKRARKSIAVLEETAINIECKRSSEAEDVNGCTEQELALWEERCATVREQADFMQREYEKLLALRDRTKQEDVEYFQRKVCGPFRPQPPRTFTYVLVKGPRPRAPNTLCGTSCARCVLVFSPLHSNLLSGRRHLQTSTSTV